MKAKICDNLLETIDTYFNGKEGHKTDKKFLMLCERIQGKEVDLIFIGTDAFEAIDDNYWLPNCCWKPIIEEETHDNYN